MAVSFAGLVSQEVGREVDLAVLYQDVISVSAGSIARTKGLLTMVGGKIVFQQAD